MTNVAGAPELFTNVEPKVVNGLSDAETLYIDGAVGLVTSNNIVKFGVFQDSLDENGELARKIILTLVMPHQTFASLGAWITQNAEALAKIAETQGANQHSSK